MRGKNLIKEIGNNKLLFYLLICLQLSCDDRQYAFKQDTKTLPESYLEYAFDVQKGNEILSFLLDTEKKEIDILLYKNRKLSTEFSLSVNQEKTNHFLHVVNRQILIDQLLKITKSNGEFRLQFSISNGRNVMSTTYNKIANFRREVSPEFNNLILFLRKEKLVNEFFKEKQPYENN
ncbi:hypothetical protein [Flavobacterium sp.]|uniref:hypothetical protein n=1 Tax=Flavobacterium sp. TaxID=239 RepID=UPI0026388D8A|nr:hypothetical protein [Flavobacterium sp.]